MKNFGVSTLAVAIAVVICVSGCDRGHEEALAEARLSYLTTNLLTIRAQLELYRLQHNDAYPLNVVYGLTKKTTASGVVSATGEYGPYMQVFPANPFIDDPVGIAAMSSRHTKCCRGV